MRSLQMLMRLSLMPHAIVITSEGFPAALFHAKEFRCDWHAQIVTVLIRVPMSRKRSSMFVDLLTVFADVFNTTEFGGRVMRVTLSD